MTWAVRGREIDFAGGLVVGILNVTPDSFSDGGLWVDVDAAVERACAMLDEGARVIDVGGESTRPGFEPVSVEEEILRVVPVIERLVKERPECIVSVDTTKAAVADAALAAGAHVVNDVWGLQADEVMAGVVAQFGAGVIAMRNGRDGKTEGSVVERIRASWEKSVAIAKAAGVGEAAIVLDPGVGFGTSREEDLEILRGLEELCDRLPVMLGTSRKRITAMEMGLAVDERLGPTLATTVAGANAGVALYRVHDVRANVLALRMANLINGKEQL